MNKNNIILLIIAILLFAFSVIFVLSSFSNKPQNLSNNPNNLSVPNDTTNIENTAPSEDELLSNINYEDFTDFKFLDENNNELKISSFLGRPIAIFFSDFIDNAEDSTEFLQTLEIFYEDYIDQVQFFTIDKNDVPDYASSIEFYKDIDGNEKYNVEQLPTLLFIDSEGNIINQVTKIDEDSLEANLDLICENY